MSVPVAENKIFYDLFKEFKNILPSSSAEGILYIVVVIVIILIVKLLEYTNIQMYIKSTSRCYRNVMLSNYSADTYIIKGYTMDNVEIIKVVYDFKELTSTIEIKAPKGTVLNKLKIDIYNLKTREIDELQKIFYSVIDYDLLNEGMIYEGTPELVKFMQLYNTSFFEKKFEQMKK